MLSLRGHHDKVYYGASRQQGPYDKNTMSKWKKGKKTKRKQELC